MTGPSEVWQLPHEYVGRRVLRFDSVASTNDIPVEPGDAVLADEQTAGRGQYGRTWLARPGTSVLLSMRLDPPPELRRPAILTAWAAVSVCETILRVMGRQATIKWPNDVLLHGKKVCGVLIEQGKSVIAGIGFNINQSAADFEAAGLPLAGSLAAATGQSFDTAEIARELLGEMDREYGLLMKGELTTLEARWKRRLGLLGREVVAECFDGVRVRGRLTECAFGGIEIGDVRLVPETIRALAEPLAA